MKKFHIFAIGFYKSFKINTLALDCLVMQTFKIFFQALSAIPN